MIRTLDKPDLVPIVLHLATAQSPAAAPQAFLVFRQAYLPLVPGKAVLTERAWPA